MTSDLSSNAALPPTALHVRVRLSIMMFLQYAIWGAWLPLFFAFLTGHRGIAPEQAGYLFSIGAVGALFAPFIAGQIADRWFNTEKFLAISHLVGAVLVWQIATAQTWGMLALFGLLYSLVYAPTLALSNALAFHHIVDRDRDFGKVRVWGTIGWIAVGIGVGQWLLYRHTPVDLPAAEVAAAQVAGMGDSLRLSGILGVIMGLYCLTLPKTPPRPGREPFAAAEALREVFAKRSLWVLFLISFPVACVHQFYFVLTAPFLNTLDARATFIDRIFGVGGGGLMTIGQISEIVVLAVVPLIAKKFSRKMFLTVGLTAYIVRFFVFAYLPEPALVIPALALHGLVFGCFFFIAFMIVDEQTTKDVRASAQSLYNLVVVGLGVIVGNLFAGRIAGMATRADGTMDFQLLFSVPMWVTVLCFVLLLLFYPRLRPQTAGGESVCPRCGSVRVGAYCANCGASVADADVVAPAQEVAR